MPDRDGIETLSQGRAGCVTCGATFHRWQTSVVNEHRHRCGRWYRREYGARRGPSRDEQTAADAIERAIGTAA